MYHTPVLLLESIKNLITDAKGIYIDATFGGGGHSREILKNLYEDGRLIAIDKDDDASYEAKKIISNQFTFIKGDFKNIEKILQSLNIESIDGIIADLGISSYQIDKEIRGFSIRFDSDLDMRMDQKQSINAKLILNNYPLQKLTQILKEYGELKNAEKLAKVIINCRTIKKLNTTFDLKNILTKFAPKWKENKFFARIFQAIRIEVNSELETLKCLLHSSANIIRENGKIVIISYHSLEDRLVKNYLKTGNFEGNIYKDTYGNILRPFRPLQNKVIIPSQEEIGSNNRARSAKMRVGIRS